MALAEVNRLARLECWQPLLLHGRNPAAAAYRFVDDKARSDPPHLTGAQA